MTEDWRARGVCRDMDAEIWFPNPSDRDGVMRAVAVCLACPVVAECRRWAEDTRQEFGVWGAIQVDHPEHATPAAPVLPSKERREHLLENIEAMTAKGKTAKQIGEELRITARQVCRYRSEIAGSKGGKPAADLVAEGWERTRKVAELTEKGWTSGEISLELGVSKARVHWHRARSRETSVSA